MKYLDQNTCEYLVSLGCTSESGYVYSFTYDYVPTEPHTWQLMQWVHVQKPFTSAERNNPPVPAFSLEDILRKENAEKIWPNGTQCLVVGVPHDGSNHDCSEFTQIYWREKLDLVLAALHAHPDTWPQEIAELINPPQEKL